MPLDQICKPLPPTTLVGFLCCRRFVCTTRRKLDVVYGRPQFAYRKYANGSIMTSSKIYSLLLGEKRRWGPWLPFLFTWSACFFPLLPRVFRSNPVFVLCSWPNQVWLQLWLLHSSGARFRPISTAPCGRLYAFFRPFNVFRKFLLFVLQLPFLCMLPRRCWCCCRAFVF